MFLETFKNVEDMLLMLFGILGEDKDIVEVNHYVLI